MLEGVKFDQNNKIFCFQKKTQSNTHKSVYDPANLNEHKKTHYFPPPCFEATYSLRNSAFGSYFEAV